MEEKKTPLSSQKRFPLYLRALQQLSQRGFERVMSYQIGNMCNVAADTVRRDLMYIHHKGKTAAGYEINSLIEALSDEIGTNEADTELVMIGVGNIGQGLLKYNLIPSHVGKIVAAYDVDPNKIGTVINNVPVYSLDSINENFPEKCKIAIVTIPKEGIDDVVGKLIKKNVHAIINFSDGVPRKRNNIIIYQVDLAKIVSEIIYEFKNNKIENQK